MGTIHREPRTAEINKAKLDDTIRSKKPTVGGRIVEIALGLVGSHYLNSAYGATPGGNDGASCRPGGVQLIADPKRLNPVKQAKKEDDLAVLAAQTSFTRTKEDKTTEDKTTDKKKQIPVYCVCGGNYESCNGRVATPFDADLKLYLESLKGLPPMAWNNCYGSYTPRRVYGPAPNGDIGGKLVWGQSCKGIRHFDCIGFISYCLSKATGNRALQCEISQWRTPGMPMVGSKVYHLSANKPEALMDGDILVQADHHIAWVAANGTIIQAADTHLGVHANSRFDLAKPGNWTHLVRLPL